MKVLTLSNLQYFKDNCDATYVEQVEGKGLSTNDFTNEDKEAIRTLVESGGTIEEVENSEIDNMFAKGDI